MPRGFFLIATASDIPSHDEEIAEFVQSCSNDLNKLFHQCLNTALVQNQLQDGIDIKVAVPLVMGIFSIYN